MSEDITYEQARAQLTEVVEALESGGAPLADAVELWRRGEKLADICQGFLDGARLSLATAALVEQAVANQQSTL